MGTRGITNRSGSGYMADGGRGLSNKGGVANGHAVISKGGGSYTTDGSRAVANKSGVLGSFKKGGKVKKTGKYILHKGERVLNRVQAKKNLKITSKPIAKGRAAKVKSKFLPRVTPKKKSKY